MKRKLALITGGTSGIGLSAARRLRKEWDLALVFAEDEARANDALMQLEDAPVDAGGTAPAKVRCYKFPLSSESDYSTLSARVREDFGVAPSALVHAAGRIRDDLLLNSEPEDIRSLLETHLHAGILLSHVCVREMYRAKFGRIVFLSSISARYSKRGQSIYAAAKGGIEAFARTLALEVAHRGVTVNCIAPGLIETPMTTNFVTGLADKGIPIGKRIPAGRIGKPEEVGALVAYLLSGEAAYITGAVVTIDGGRSLGDPST